MDGVRPTTALGLMVVLTAAVLLLSTRLGLGVSVDGTAYLGFRPQDIGHAPLYSWVMRVAALLPFDIRLLARLYQAALYAATAAVSWQLLRNATGHALPAWAGALLIVFTGQALSLYSMALSEPTFVLLLVLAFWALSSWVDTRSPRLFVGAAVAASLATLARYPGVAVVATGTLTVFAAGSPALRQRCARAAAFGSIGLLPALGWMAYVARESGTAGGRQAALAGTADTQTFYGGLLEAARYVLPTEFPASIRIAALAVVLAALAAATLAFYLRARTRGADAASASERPRHRYLPLILLAFVATYSAAVVLAVLVEPYLPISDRYLYPAYVALVLLGATTAHSLTRTPALGRGVAVAVAAFVALSVVRAAKVADDGFEHGWGYSAETWRSSQAVAYVNALPQSAVVYSDDPYALLYLTSHEVHNVPNVIERRLGTENPDYEQQISQMQRRLRATHGVVVIFDRDRGEFVMPVLPHLLEVLPLEEKARLDDATVYVIAEHDLHAAQGGY
ncbi:MAG TPA: glycosyltransferase family 39 protein [Gammaproteobacteria bacterium]|nr:glycosyltransferase family 39 protein [Gammaproteobacteria bacterium]